MEKRSSGLLKYLRWVFLLCIINTIGVDLVAQDSDKLFEGYVYFEDSIPVENAYIINYRNQKIVTTDSLGYFKTSYIEGDSLMINHISLSPRVVYSNLNSARENTYYIDYKIYTLQTCVMRTEGQGVNIDNFNRNIQVIYKSIEKLGYKRNMFKPMDRNKMPIDLSKLGSGNASVNLLTVRDLIKQARRNRYLKVKTKSK